ncbi:MAG: hypothetical protein FJW90_11030 [Actinobacteria bacterium]|nr:hypothetical protein [Actinomycetota bacterium]
MTDGGAQTLSDPRQAVSYLEEISPEMRGCAILDDAGHVLASSGDGEAWKRVAAKLIAAMDQAGGEPAAHAHVATGDGEVFCVRHGGTVAVAVTERFVLASLMLFDLRNLLRELEAAS